LGAATAGVAVRGSQPPLVILLDTNAVIWWHAGHRRARKLERLGGGVYLSPASALELQFLVEVGKVRLRKGAHLREIIDDARWAVDSPPSADWFEGARGEAWTRDPFDRLIVAHARLRGWRLATADDALVERLGEGGVLEL
jgi:PIN domain nuclease of toxin-antitoxin system